MPKYEKPYLRLIKTPPEKKETPPPKKKAFEKFKNYLEWKGLDLKTIMIGSAALSIILSVCILGIMAALVSLAY